MPAPGARTVRMSDTVHVVVPDWIDDHARPSGGNTYDRRICSGLAALGWIVRVHPIAGRWPVPERADLARLAVVLDDIDDEAIVVVDGLIGSAAPSVLVPRAGRLRQILLLHLPLDLGAPDATSAEVALGERSVLSAASAVLTTSRWTRGWLLDQYGLHPDAVHAAVPGVDIAEPTSPSPPGGRLLCVAAVTPIKGHDVLIGALAGLDELGWSLRCVGSLSAEPGWVAQLQKQVAAAGLADRVEWSGTLTGPGLADAYAAADVIVVASRAETYGLVVTEALARGLPAVAVDVGGLPESLGAAPDGRVPGLLVSPADPAALRAALRRWLTEPVLREHLTAAARARRRQLRSWAATAADVSRVLTDVARDGSVRASASASASASVQRIPANRLNTAARPAVARPR